MHSNPDPLNLGRQRWRIEHADCLQALPALDADTADAIITDPPYGIGLGGARWDQPTAMRPRSGALHQTSVDPPTAFQGFCAEWGRACLGVLKPGAHLAAFGSPRTAHRLALGLEEAGFELRDVMMWIHSQGYPKSRAQDGTHNGWGTGLKPAYEPILLARKPLQGSLSENVGRHQTGAIHINACRIPGAPRACEGRSHASSRSLEQSGRWPANLLFSHSPTCSRDGCEASCPVALLGERQRFFYCAKPNRTERDAGCEQLPRRRGQTYRITNPAKAQSTRRAVANVHPTVKPIELMRWLVRLLTPPDGLIVDPFTGSGSTGAAAVLEGARFLGIEREADYVPIATARVLYWAGQAQPRSGPGKQ